MIGRYSLLLLATLAAGPAPALAQGAVNLSWNDCGASGQNLETFACDTNSGSHRMVASFVSPLPLTQLVGVEVIVDVAFNLPAVPSWWQAQSSGGCRFPAITSNVNFTAGPASCGDPWGGLAAGGVFVQPGVPFPDRVRLRGAAALMDPTAVDDVTEYYAFEFLIGNAKTVGPAACAGCSEPACVLLSSIRLVQPAGVGDYTLSNPLTNNLVGWQCTAFFGHGGCGFDCSTPTRRPTWGAVKGLYR